MKNKKALSFTALALSVVSLSGCGFQTAIETMALTAAMDLPYILNNVDLETQQLAQFETMPTSTSKRADISYVQNVLAIPKSIELEQYGLSVAFEIASTSLDNFLVFEQSLDELGEGGEAPAGLEGMSLTAFVLLPVGIDDFAFLEDEEAQSSVMAFADYMAASFDVMDAVKITEQPTIELAIDVTGKIGKAEKTKTFYFTLNSITLNDLAALADTSLEELGVPPEIEEYIVDWPEEPATEVLDFVGENWPTDMPPEVQELIDNDTWPSNVPEEWQEDWPTPEEAETWLEENWPENLSDIDWIEIVGIVGAQNLNPGTFSRLTQV